MATYTKTTDFLAKDSLPLNNAAKYVKGSEIDTEYNNIATADADNMKKSAMGTGVETFLGTPSSANLAAAVTNETGSGLLVFNSGPILTAPLLTGGSFKYTLTGGSLAADRVLNVPVTTATDTLATLGLAQTWTAAQTFRAASAVRSEAASTQDAMILAGRAGGSSSYAVTLMPTTLTASRTVTFPDAATSIPVASYTYTFSGPTAARTYTLPDANASFAILGANTFTAAQALGNNNLTGIKTATFNGEGTIAGTTGAQTVDWTAAQNYKQTEPTGAITYTFTAPPGVCHLQLRILSDGTSTAYTHIWPASVKWLGSTWAALANKNAMINFWYDGTDYWAMGANEV